MYIIHEFVSSKQRAIQNNEVRIKTKPFFLLVSAMYLLIFEDGIVKRLRFGAVFENFLLRRIMSATIDVKVLCRHFIEA